MMNIGRIQKNFGKIYRSAQLTTVYKSKKFKIRGYKTLMFVYILNIKTLQQISCVETYVCMSTSDI
jgi:hypothetical protein